MVLMQKVWGGVVEKGGQKIHIFHIQGAVGYRHDDMQQLEWLRPAVGSMGDWGQAREGDQVVEQKCMGTPFL